MVRRDGLVCWCEDCEKKFYYEDDVECHFHNIGKLYEIKDGKKVRE